MTISRVKKAAELRGIYFNGEKRWLNNVVGYGYEIFIPQDRSCFFQADSLDGIYQKIMSIKKGDK